MDVRDDGRVRATGVRRLGLAGLGECERRRRYSNGPVQLRRYAVHPTPRTRAPNFGRVSTSQAVFKRHSSGTHRVTNAAHNGHLGSVKRGSTLSLDLKLLTGLAAAFEPKRVFSA